MMGIQKLIGFLLLRVSFSKSSYTFEFCGKLGEEHKTFRVSTSYCFSVDDGEFSDACEKFSLEIWDFLETRLTDVVVEENENSAKAVFSFDNDKSFSIWSDEPLIDNLLIATDQETEEWFSVS